MSRSGSRKLRRRRRDYRNSDSVASTLRALRPIYGCNNHPSRSTLERLVAKFETTGTVQNVAVPVRQRSVRSVENIAATEVWIEESPDVSLTRPSQALVNSVTSLWRTLRNDLGLHKIKLTQDWSRLATRSVVCSWIGLSNNLKMIRIFIEKSASAIRLISQNMLYWPYSNSHVLHGSLLHPEKITV